MSSAIKQFLDNPTEWTKNAIQTMWGWIKSLLVEPPSFIFACGIFVFMNVSNTIIYRKLCQVNYADETDCDNLDSDTHYQNLVQEKSAIYSLWINLAYVIVSFPAILVWSAYADVKKDRKMLLLVPIFGWGIPLFVYLLETTFVHFPLWVLILGNGLGGCFGQFSLLYIGLYGYLTEVTDNKQYLSSRFALILVVFNLAIIVAGVIDSGLRKRTPPVSLAWILVIALGIMFCGMLYFSLIPDPAKRRLKQLRTKSEMEKPEDNQKNDDEELAKPKATIGRAVLNSLLLIKDALYCYVKPRPQHRRTLLLMVFMSQVMFKLAVGGDQAIVNYYVYRSPINFTLPDYTEYNSGSSGIHLVGTLGGSFFFKWLNVPDTVLGLIGFVSHMAGYLILAFSYNKMMVWLNAVASLFGHLGDPALTALLIGLADSDEHGRIISGSGIFGTFSSLLCNAIFNSVYHKTESTFAGLVYILAAIFCVIGSLLLILVQLGIWKFKVKLTTDRRNKKASHDNKIADHIASTSADTLERAEEPPSPKVLAEATSPTYGEDAETEDHY